MTQLHSNSSNLYLCLLYQTEVLLTHVFSDTISVLHSHIHLLLLLLAGGLVFLSSVKLTLRQTCQFAVCRAVCNSDRYCAAGCTDEACRDWQ